MGDSGAYIVYGTILLVIIPVVMAQIGSTFGTDFTKSDFENEDVPTLVKIAAGFSNLSDLPIIGGLFEGVANAFLGYSLLPWWINLFITTIPIVLIVRGLGSTSA